MTHPIARYAVAAVIAAATLAVPLSAAATTAPVSTAQCPPGETGVI